MLFDTLWWKLDAYHGMKMLSKLMLLQIIRNLTSKFVLGVFTLRLGTYIYNGTEYKVLCGKIVHIL